jgi:uncharacterized protein (TIGR02231 family)
MKTILTVLTLLLTLQLNAADVLNLSTELKSAKVFLRGTELTHYASANLNKGINEIVLDRIAENLDINSIQVSANGDAVILSINYRKNYLKAQEKTGFILSLEDSLENLKLIKQTTEDEIKVSQMEIDLIAANNNLGGEKGGPSVVELKNMAKFFKEKLNETFKEISKKKQKIVKVEKDIKRIEKQLNEYKNKKTDAVSEIVVSVLAKNKTKLNLELSYIAGKAGWKPSYDIRSESISSPLQLDFNANVWQDTGLDWNNIDIVISTRNPNENNNKPELNPWFIDFVREQPVLYRGLQKNKAGGRVEETFGAPAVLEMDEAEVLADYTQTFETQLSVEYTTSIKYDIPSDGKPHIIALKNYSVPAEYKYYTAPKFDHGAFLVAEITDWNEYNLLPGQANIYFENAYVGKTFINPATTEKKLDVSLGRDKSIVIERKLLKDFTEDKFLSSDIERIFGYEITVGNKKKSQVELVLEEQIPISKNEDIEVKLVESSGAEVDRKLGLVTWDIKLNSNENTAKKFVYSVRYPSSKRIPNL